MSAKAGDYATLVGRGCLCGSENPADCPLHEAGDNRGIAAFSKAGLPLAFPYPTTCSICGAEGLTYPNVALDDPEGDDPFGLRPTLICPRCSAPPCEARLVAEAERGWGKFDGYKLNGRRVFADPLADTDPELRETATVHRPQDT